MNKEQWQHVKQLLDEALAVEAAERPAFVDRCCNGDAELRRELESLLSAHEDAGTKFLKEPAANLKMATRAMAQAAPAAGQRIGVYEIVEEIGHGGMGEVYRARRADGQYRKEVAIKMVRGGFDSRHVVERFHNERQILASLDHPNVARLLDGGTTEQGVPYLVMELIEGQRIDSYCDEHGLAITERLRLFVEVCGAVQYAHQRLVIHRDIKPGNILVTKEGVPKLLDFGIAKILDPTGETAETTLARPMTPEYASPEQIRGEPITTASDVYSLGVVLYQLLTGRSPYPAATSSAHELARAICDTDPIRPSSVVMKPQAAKVSADAAQLSAEEVSLPREGAPAKLKRRLSGDLDHILLKALRKEPQGRYSSAEQFAEDIRRHLEGLPVAAVKGSFQYRARKFVGRNRVAIAAAAMVALSLVVGIGASIRSARVARRQAEIASAERARAEKRFNDVRKLANSLIFEIHDSIQSLPGATPSRKLLLDRAVEYLDNLSQDAGGDIDLQRELGWAYYRLATVQGDTTQSNLGQVRAADVSNRKATAFFEAVARANPTNVSDQLNLAMAYRWRAFFDIYEPNGRAEIARALAVTEPLIKTHGDQPEVRTELADEYAILGDIQDATGDRLQAIDSYRRVRDLRRELLRANPGDKELRRKTAKATVYLAHLTGRFGSGDEAMQLMNQGIADFAQLAKATEGDPGVVREWSAAMSRRGEVELQHGNPTAAYADYQSLQDRIGRLAKLDPENKMLQSDLWVAEFQKGRALAVAGRYGEALPILQRSLEGYSSLHLEADVGPGPPAMQAWIGEAQAATHRWNEALKSYEKAAAGLAEDQNNYDDARCDLAMMETKIGNLLLQRRELDKAAEYYAKALETGNLNFSLEHMDIPALYAVADAYAGLGEVDVRRAQASRDPDRARLLREALSLYEKSLAASRQIPSFSRINGNGYLARDRGEIARRVGELRRQ